MVSLERPSQRGGGSLGCLLSLLLFAGALYYGINIGQVYPGRIVIQAEYTDQVDLPLFKHTFVLRPRAEAPL